MFFIGGINSVLPFILYVSLIWICMAIGFGKTIKIFQHSRAISTQTIHKDEPANTVTAFVLTPETDVHELRVDIRRSHYTDIALETRPVAIGITRLEESFGTNHQVASLAFPNAYRGPPAG